MTADELFARWEAETAAEVEARRNDLRISITLTPDNVRRIMALHDEQLSRGAVSMDELVCKLWVEDVVRAALYGEVKG